MLNKKRLFVFICLIHFLVLSDFVLAGDYISDVTASATSNYVTRQAENMVNDSGLIMTMDGLNGSHAVVEDGKMWLGGPPLSEPPPSPEHRHVANP